jgi:hypothetical protein
MSNLQLYIREYFADFVGYVLGAKAAPDGSMFAFSYSSLHKLATSPRHFFLHTVERRYAPQPDKDTDAILLGKTLHHILLECYCRGESMSSSRYQPIQQHDRRTKQGKADAEAQAAEFAADGLIPVPPDVWQTAQGLIYALIGMYKHKGQRYPVNAEAMRILDGAIATEVAFSYICPVHKIPIRGVIDEIGRDADGYLYFADLKSMRAVDGKSVFYAARDNGYDLQAYVYAEAIYQIYGDRPRCGYLVCAGEGEHTNVVRLTLNDMSAGRDKYNRAVAAYNACCFEPQDFLKSYDFFNE